MKDRFRPHRVAATLTATVLSLLLAGCAGSTGPTTTTLKTSFADQIASIDHVENFGRNGDELTFTRLDGAGDEIQWRVVIDEATVEQPREDGQPLRGIVKSSWFMNDRPVRISGDVSNLPLWVLDAGLSQECWALWEEEDGWGWT